MGINIVKRSSAFGLLAATALVLAGCGSPTGPRIPKDDGDKEPKEPPQEQPAMNADEMSDLPIYV